MFEFSSKFLNDIQKAIKLFSKSTKNTLLFASTTGVAVDCNTLLFDSQVAISYLQKVNLANYVIFPLTYNDSLSGFFILDTAELDSDSVKLCREFIKAALGEILNEKVKNVQILNQLELPRVKTLVQSLSGILNISESKINSSQNSHLTNQQQKNESSPNDIEKNIMMALKYINTNIDKSLTLENVSQQIYLSPSYLSRIFKSYFNDNFINYINLQKLALAQKKLVFSNVSINKLAHQIGFSQTSYFTKIFKEKVGMTPSKYRKYNSAIRKIYTIPRDLRWRSNKSVYEISKDFFIENSLSFKARDLNGYPYIYSIDELTDVPREAGWIYTVDCAQPTTPPSEINVLDKSVIQWIYTEKII